MTLQQPSQSESVQIKQQLPPKPKICLYSKIKVAPRPGESKHKLGANQSRVYHCPSSSNTILSTTEKNISIKDSNQANSNNSLSNSSHKESSNTNSSSEEKQNNNNNQDVNNSKETAQPSKPIFEFPPITVKPPPFKPRQYKYPSGNLTGTINFPDFDGKLDEMQQIYQGQKIKS